MKKNTPNFDAQIKRREMVEQGAYDGRYRSKCVPDKKKLADKKAARRKVEW